MADDSAGASVQASIVVRPVTRRDDLEALGHIVLESYTALPGHPPEPGYEASLADVAGRLATNTLFGAFQEGRPIGCVTYVADLHDAYAEDLQSGEAGFRMLGVSPAAQGHGVGAALVTRCLETARENGRSSVFIHSGEWMHAAHRLYRRLGFARVTERDWHIDDPPVTLYGFTRPLDVGR